MSTNQETNEKTTDKYCSEECMDTSARDCARKEMARIHLENQKDIYENETNVARLVVMLKQKGKIIKTEKGFGLRKEIEQEVEYTKMMTKGIKLENEIIESMLSRNKSLFDELMEQYQEAMVDQLQLARSSGEAMRLGKEQKLNYDAYDTNKKYFF